MGESITDESVFQELGGRLQIVDLQKVGDLPILDGRRQAIHK
jgi:hypothetical protein